MPANRVVETYYIGPFSSIDKVNSSTLYKPGELGIRVDTTGNKEYQLVQLDSGATASSPVGVVATGQLAFWKSKSSYIVTNDIIQAVGGSTGCRNEVAGVFTNAVTAAGFTFVQQKGNNSAVVFKSGSPGVGDWLVADNTAATAQATSVAIGTAPTVQMLGKVAVAGTSITAVNADLDIPGIP